MKRFIGLLLSLALLFTVCALFSLPSSAAGIRIEEAGVQFDRVYHGDTPCDTVYIAEDEEMYLIAMIDDYGYSGGISWWDNTAERAIDPDEPLICGHVYNVSVALRPEDGYYFDADTEATLDHCTDTTTWIFPDPEDESRNLLLVSGNYTCTEAVIDLLYLSVGMPVHGTVVSNYADIFGDHVHLSSYTNSKAGYYNGMRWVDETDGTTLDRYDTFNLDHEYTANFIFEPDENYLFYYNAYTRINNGEYVDRFDYPVYDGDGLEHYLEIRYTFPMVAKYVIENVQVYVEEPYVGANPYELDLRIPVGAPYSFDAAFNTSEIVGGVGWQNRGVPYYNGGGMLVEGSDPIFTAYLVPDYGYEFAFAGSETTVEVLVNGEPAYAHAVDYGTWQLYITYDFGELKAPPVIDINGDGVLTIEDVTAFLDILAGVAEEPDGVMLDLDGNPGIDIGDVTVVLDYLSGARS